MPATPHDDFDAKALLQRIMDGLDEHRLNETPDQYSARMHPLLIGLVAVVRQQQAEIDRLKAARGL